MTPLEFLNELWQYKPEDQFVLIWTHHDKHSRWFTSVPAAAEYVADVNGIGDVYVGVGLSKVDYGPARRCKSEEVSGICGIGSDLDVRSGAHGTKPLPATVDEALSMLPPGMPPSILLSTGNGVHVWWLLKEPCIFGSEREFVEGMD